MAFGYSRQSLVVLADLHDLGLSHLQVRFWARSGPVTTGHDSPERALSRQTYTHARTYWPN